MQCRDTVIERIARRADDPEGGVAMLLALMTILIVLSISIAVAGVTLSQVKPTQLNRKTVSTQNAAEAGFDVALNRIRNAASGTTKDSDGNIVPAGVRASLPCGPITGSVTGGAASDTSYSVKLGYYATDPTGQSSGWLTTNKLACPIPAAPAPMANFVTLSATGSAATIPGTRVGSGNRIVQTVYALNTTNSHIVGGTIPFLDNSTYCLAVSDASNNVVVGDPIKVATCDSTSKLQSWSYTQNLQLQIVATDGSLLCMSAANAYYTVVKLATCSTAALPSLPYQQVWSYNDNSQFQASNSAENGLQGNTCLNLYTGTPGATHGSPATTVAAEALGDLVDVDVCGAAVTPTASVGAGAAGTTLRRFQLVNYQNFGRCLDDTYQQVNSVWMIGFPCKQDPLATNLTWNQVYYTGISGGNGGTGASRSYGGSPGGNTVIATPPVYNALGVQTAPGTGCQISSTTACQIITFVNKGLDGSQPLPVYWCLEAGTVANPSAPVNGTLVDLEPCSTTDNYQKWTYTQAIPSNYAQQYLIQPYGASASNLCLSMTLNGTLPPSTTWPGGGTPPASWGWISLQTCDGKAWQKWNAPPNPQTSAQKNTFEVPNP